MSLLIDAFAIVNCFHRKHTSDFVKIQWNVILNADQHWEVQYVLYVNV